MTGNALQHYVIKSIPRLAVFEKTPLNPLDLHDYIQVAAGSDGALTFSAQLDDGRALPQGLICTSDGILGGIPQSGTAGLYALLIDVHAPDQASCQVKIDLTIRDKVNAQNPNNTFQKADVWKALLENLPLPDNHQAASHTLTQVERDYLAERWGCLTVWDILNISSPTPKHLLALPDLGPHYVIYDRGSYLIAAPKDLYSLERTLWDALQAARVLAREVYKRNWTMELAGLGKMVKEAWVELQLQGDIYGRRPKVHHFEPTAQDIKVYTARAQQYGIDMKGLQY